MSWKAKLYKLEFQDIEKCPYGNKVTCFTEYYCFSINTRYMSESYFDEKISEFFNYLHDNLSEIVSVYTCNPIKRRLYNEILIDEYISKDNYDIEPIKKYVNNTVSKNLQSNESVNCKIYNYQISYAGNGLFNHGDLTLLDTFTCTKHTSIYINFEL